MRATLVTARNVRRRACHGILVLLMALPGSAITASAQDARGIVAGLVSDAGSRAALPGVTVQIEGTTLTATTTDDGRYRIANVPASASAVLFRRLGYLPARESFTVAPGASVTVDAAMQASAVSLDQMVVTGTAGVAPRRSLGNTVATVSASDELQKSAAPDFTSLLRARAAGVDMLGTTGRLGGGPAINIRGQSSMGLGNGPLIYVDGIRLDARTGIAPRASSGASNLSQGAAVGSTLNDINPNDIESIEIIKGPAASTIYGTEAANGVIQIVTKKGTGQSPTWRSNVHVGSLSFRDAAGRIGSNYVADASGKLVEWNGVKAAEDLGAPLFTTGMERHYVTSVSGGAANAKYYASAGYDNDLGVEPNNSQRQFSSHLNASTQLATATDIAVSMNYLKRSSHVGAEGGLSAMTSALWGHPILWPGAAGGFYTNLPPAWPQKQFDNAVRTDRFTGSATLNNQVGQWLTQRLVVGLDQNAQDLRAIIRYAPPELTPFLSAARIAGGIGQTHDARTQYTMDYSVTGKVDVTSGLNLASSLGLQYNRSDAFSTFAGGSGFAGPGLETITATATRDPVVQSEVINTTIGSYFQEQVSWRNRLFLTGAVRVDNNSAFGADLKWVTYPKVGASWVVSDEGFWGRAPSWFGTLRARAAYGASGRQPTAFSALQTYATVIGPGGLNGVTPDNLGNPDLRPERSVETEFGLDAEVFDRLNLQLTYYRKNTTDQIVSQPVPPSTGFASSRISNLGRVVSSGLELQASYEAINNSTLGWTVDANLSTAENEVKANIPTAITTAGRFNVVGYPIQGFWARRIVSADRDATTGQATNILCQGAGGAAVACSSAPFAYIGRTFPKVTGAIGNTLRIGKSLRLHALTDFKSGFGVYNFDAVIRCAGVFARSLCRMNYEPRNYDILEVAAAQNSSRVANATSHWFQDAAFIKLRELSATYTLPSRWVRFLSGSTAALTVAGRELYTWTSYGGTDPEAFTNSAQAIVPPLTRLSVALSFTR